MSRIPIHAQEKQIKSWLKEQVLGYIRDKIEYSVSIIANTGAELVSDTDNILVYGKSQSVIATLLKAKEHGKTFRVTIADSRPRLEGKKTLEILSNTRIHCTYMLVSSLSYHMPDITRVFLGSAGISNNGYLQNRAGTALVCCVAHAFKKPVLVFSETYKFSKTVLINGFTNNELGNAEDLVNTSMYLGDGRGDSCLTDYKDEGKLHILNMRYDFTPPQYIDMLVTEVGCIPVTSVPVVIREFNKDLESTEIASNFFEEEGVN